MNIDESRELTNQALQQIATTTDDITRWTHLIEGAKHIRANEDAQIYDHLATAFSNIFDPKIFPTLRDNQGYKKTIFVSGHELEVIVTHRATLETINGVDVIYNFRDWKALAFQHKKRSASGSLSVSQDDKEQKDKIKLLCGQCKLPRSLNGDEGFIRPHCSSLYIIGDDKTPIRHAVSACRFDEYRKVYNKSSVSALGQLPHPSDLATVDSMFLQCTIGRRQAREKDIISLKLLEDSFINRPDLVFLATLTRKQNAG